VNANGATIEFDCANGSMQRIMPDAQGHFEARGTFITERGGPTREISAASENAKTGTGAEVGQQAVYAGRIVGNTMTLTVSIKGKQQVGPFRLTRGAAPRLRKCL